ncbi:MAG: hypothetical protein CL609_11635 [Anaerolineaceae bacterium]|nr:hypothetical protein [Anaerolineaceae bacterium]
MKKFMRRLNLSKKFFIFSGVAIMLPIILIAASAYWFVKIGVSNGLENLNQSITSTMGLILILICLVSLSLVGLILIYINRQLISPTQKIVSNLKALDVENEVFPEPIDDSSLNNEAKDLVVGFNEFIKLLKQKNNREKALRQSEERYSLAIQGANDGIWDWELKKNFCYFSQRWRYMLGYTQESVHNTVSEWFTRVHPDDITSLKADINAHLEGQTPHFENEHRIRHANGTYIWVSARGVATFDEEDGSAVRFAGSISDISERKAYEARLLHDAMHDPLTNLPNRAYFTQILENALGRTQRREDYHAAVLYLDLDRFKIINDSLGHQVGDKILIETTQRLRHCLRTMDTVSRFGGDEFAIILEEINGLQDAIHIARRILQELMQPIHIPNQDLVCNTSIGIVLITRGYQDAEEILRDADTAMYQAKANGRGRFEIFDKDMHAYTLNKLRLENELRQAMHNKEFKVFYQPIVDAKNGNILFVEALLRWQHPQKGLIPTDAFIPLAEESGLIRALNKWVLNAACAEARQWFDNGFEQLIISVNISPTLLINPELGDLIRGTLSDYNLPPEALQLEITENIGVYNSGIAIQNLFELTSIGVKICLDDYGLVASSLEQLKRLPIYGLKIAQSFVKDLPVNNDDAAISKAIIAIAHILGMQVFAAGIENQQQLNYLVEKECNFLQGYFFAPPMHRSEFLNNLIGYGTNIKTWEPNE